MHASKTGISTKSADYLEQEGSLGTLSERHTTSPRRSEAVLTVPSFECIEKFKHSSVMFTFAIQTSAELAVHVP